MALWDGSVVDDPLSDDKENAPDAIITPPAASGQGPTAREGADRAGRIVRHGKFQLPRKCDGQVSERGLLAVPGQKWETFFTCLCRPSFTGGSQQSITDRESSARREEVGQTGVSRQQTDELG
jgi:hypothetical protein